MDKREKNRKTTKAYLRALERGNYILYGYENADKHYKVYIKTPTMPAKLCFRLDTGSDDLDFYQRHMGKRTKHPMSGFWYKELKEIKLEDIKDHVIGALKPYLEMSEETLEDDINKLLDLKKLCPHLESYYVNKLYTLKHVEEFKSRLADDEVALHEAADKAASLLKKNSGLKNY